MASVNKVILLGNLGADPDVKYLENDTVVTKLSLATTESYKNKNGDKVEHTEWHEIDLWNNQAKVAEQYLKKGDSVYIEGKIRTDRWQDEEGNNKKKMKIRATNMQLLPKRAKDFSSPISSSTSSTSDSEDSTPSQQSTEESENPTDNLPF